MKALDWLIKEEYPYAIVMSRDNVAMAIDRYSKKQSMDFLEWCVNNFESNDLVSPYKKWRNVISGEVYNTEDLYRLFMAVTPNEVQK